MVGPSRYNISESGADIEEGVLKNKLNITDQGKLDDAETILLEDAYAHFFDLLETEEIEFTVKLLFLIHQFFLSPLYSWAGKTRTINISKGNVLFAPVEHIETSLQSFKQILKEQLPSKNDPTEKVALKLAVIHNEFNAIHPFREGNGRTIRLFLDLLAVRCGYKTINWSKKSQEHYIQACIDGMVQEHKSMTDFILNGLEKH